jgi:hypothetical protein
MRWWIRTATALMLGLPLIHAQAAFAADSIPLPFDAGATARVIQGYNGGTHVGASRFGLDLVLSDRETSGAAVLAPLAGSVAWAFEPGDKTGCLEIVEPTRRFGVMLCHVLLDRPYGRGEKVSRGQLLGTVGAPGTVGNNGSAHVHMELHQGGRGSDPVPFGLPDGLPLDGQDLPATGATNEYASIALTSSNAATPPPVAVAPAPTPPRNGRPAPPVPSANHCGVGVVPAFTLGFATLKARLGDAMGEPLTCEFADPNGTGDVHQQTTRGLAFWRKGTNTPTFTNGSDHWGYTPAGWVEWKGTSVDPPTA